MACHQQLLGSGQRPRLSGAAFIVRHQHCVALQADKAGRCAGCGSGQACQRRPAAAHSVLPDGRRRCDERGGGKQSDNRHRTKMSESPPSALLWLRDDLRLADQAAVAAGSSCSTLLPLFLWPPADSAPHGLRSALQRRWRLKQLARMQSLLAAQGSKLVVQKVAESTADVTAAALAALCESVGATVVHASKRYAWQYRQEDAAVMEALAARGVTLCLHDGNVLAAPAAAAGDSRLSTLDAFAAAADWHAVQPAAAPAKLAPLPLLAEGVGGIASTSIDALWAEEAAGEEEESKEEDKKEASGVVWRDAEDVLRSFVEVALPTYAADYHRVDTSARSHLSIYLSVGAISVRQVWSAVAQQALAHAAAGRAWAADSCSLYLRSLTMREYAIHFAAAAERQLCADTSKLTSAQAELLKSWRAGQTGYPLVDAGMRQIEQEGLLHVQLRHVAACFLLQFLRLPASCIVDWMLATSLDAHLPSTEMAALYLSGGRDDSPLESSIVYPGSALLRQRMDPDGAYMLRWLPELSRLPSVWLHRPWRAPEAALAEAEIKLGRDYPAVIVNPYDVRDRHVRELEARGIRAIPSNEMDLLLLERACEVREEEGWYSVLDVPDKRLHVWMQDLEGGVKAVAARCGLHIPAEYVYELIADEKKLESWDKTWQQQDFVAHVDDEADLLYIIADTPPPPFSSMLTPRDFAQYRTTLMDPVPGVYTILYRNAVDARVPEDSTYLRGETVNVIGFRIQRLSKTRCEALLVTAVDMKGSIPKWLIGVVAKRTPNVWVERLTKAVDKYFDYRCPCCS
eukprot:PLAT11398.1.p1 GENE.PLAT11398.1~~PLAT11398.1.p1  ORF type:complete len:799 (+),score=287.29 PLAT11398.1:1011-3407(+)